MSFRPARDDRWYSTPALIREIVASLPAAITDDVLRGQITVLSRAIDGVTAQSFWPIDETVVVRGCQDHLVTHPRHLPIILLSTVARQPTRAISFPDPLTLLTGTVSNTWESIDSTQWYIDDDRAVYLAMSVFPLGLANIQLDGIFGWVENSRGLVTAVTTAEVNFGDTIVSVDDASVFRKRDIIDITGPPDQTPIRAIIESITANDLTIDAVRDATTAPVGSTVSSWGQVPNLVEVALARWIYKVLTVDGGGGGGGPIIPPGRIKRERTDSYEYERFDASSDPNSQELLGDVTGDPLADRFLSLYVAPPHLRFV